MCKWGMLEHVGSPEGNFLLPLRERGKLLSSDCQWVCLPYDFAGTVHRTEGLLAQIKESVASPKAMFCHERDQISRCWPRSWLYVTDVPAVLSEAKTFCLQKPLVQTWRLFQLVWVCKHSEFAFRLHLGFVQRVSWEWNLSAVIQSPLAAQVLFCSGALCPAKLIQVNAVLDEELLTDGLPSAL